jgi:hypothetical protein
MQLTDMWLGRRKLLVVLRLRINSFAVAQASVAQAGGVQAPLTARNRLKTMR